MDYNKLSIEEQIKIVKKDGYSIRYIKNPIEKVQLESVKESKDSIKYIKNPTDKILRYLETCNESIFDPEQREKRCRFCRKLHTCTKECCGYKL